MMENQDTSTTAQMVVEGTTNTENTVETPQVTYVNGKYKNASELEKGYINLQSRFGAFTGAPEEYTLPEGLDTEDALLKDFISLAKESNMNNDALNSFLSMYTAHEQAKADRIAKEQEEYTRQQLELLGDNAKERLSNIQDWVKANLGEKSQALLDLMTDANSVEAFEMLISKAKSPSPSSAKSEPTLDKDKLQEMRMAVDSYGNRRMAVDPEYAERVRSLEAKFFS